MCRRIIGIALCVVVFLIAGVVGYVAFNITHGGPAVSSAASAPPTPQEEHSAEQTVERLKNEVAPPAADKKPAAPAEVSLTQKEANNLLRSLPEVRKVLAQDKIPTPVLSFQDGQVAATLQLPVYRGIRARVSAVEKIWAEDGQVAYHTQGVYLGDLPAPKPVRQEVERRLRDAIEVVNKQMAGRLDSLRVDNGSLTASLAVAGRRANP